MIGMTMSDSRTGEQLCKLLEERGVSCQTNYLHTSWDVGPNLYLAMDNLDGTLTVTNLTPEQVVAATLGWIEEPDTIRNELTDSGLIDTRAELGSEREKQLEKLVSDLWQGHECGAGCAMYEECRHPLDDRCPMEERVAELGSGTCNPVETATLENATAHVMECDMCGCIYEHVNGDYERCPRCGRRVER